MKTARRSVAFTPKQMKWLQKRAKVLDMTVGEVVRRIIESKMNWDEYESRNHPKGPGFVGMPFDGPPPKND